LGNAGGKTALPLKDGGSIVTECNLEEAEAIQPTKQKGDFFKKRPGDPGGKYPWPNLELESADDDGDSLLAYPSDLLGLSRRGQL